MFCVLICNMWCIIANTIVSNQLSWVFACLWFFKESYSLFWNLEATVKHLMVMTSIAPYFEFQCLELFVDKFLLVMTSIATVNYAKLWLLCLLNLLYNMYCWSMFISLFIMLVGLDLAICLIYDGLEHNVMVHGHVCLCV